jgi:hypothetical protein
MDFFLDLISALIRPIHAHLVERVENIFRYFACNTKRAHPERDIKRGRLQVGLGSPALIP